MKLIEIERHSRGIVRLVMNHAEARNAMGEALRGELLPAFTELLNAPDCRVIVVASGLKDFSVGGDLSKMDELSNPKAAAARMSAAHRLARLLLNADKPMIAELRGYAMGAGAGLALCCDTVVMGESAAMGFPFPKVGLVPDFGIASTLARRVGEARSRQALLYARTHKAADALAFGLADEVVPDEALAARSMELAAELAELPSHALALTKRMLRQSANIDASLDLELTAQVTCFASDDFREGVGAFKEKRKPVFDGEVK